MSMTKTARKNQGSIFKRLLAYLIASCLLMAVLCVLIICLTSSGAYARRLASEMIPRVHAVARLASRYQTGQLSYDSFLDIALREQHGAQVYIVDKSGVLQISTLEVDQSAAGFDDELARYAEQVQTDGNTHVWVNWRSSNGIVVGAPITDNIQRVMGVVLMTKPARDVFSSMSGLFVIILGSCLIASALMIVPAYFGSRRISKPIQHMTDISSKMATGDFSARADDTRNDEIGQLGGALNYLSQHLYQNINELTLTRNRLNVILQDLREGVIALSADAAITYCNRAALTLFDCDAVEKLADRLPAIEEACAKAVELDEPQELFVDCGEKKLLLLLSRSQQTSEIPAGAIVVVQDVTESERLEQTRRDYVANVSHELRTPIASIRSLAETLNDGLVKKEEDRSRYYGYILRESMRLSRLINDLLELSRLQSGGIALEKKRFDLAVLLKEVSERMGETAGYSGICVRLQLSDDETLPVLSNRDRIEQTLVALMDNAIKFASDEGMIELSVRPQDDCYWVCVSNTGHIDETDLPHLFERFYKADTAHSDSSGTGLGLAIAYEALELLGEQITAENEEDCAMFRFTVHRDGENCKV